ncbi:MAG: phosphoenolpyruvate--protein phosphotransferase [Verrucomicrobia bacterium]|nr:MAG: phosphoenolpyruvate--protein phosphotransferase [Verrucomicrobiota bacterium]
MKVKSSVPEVIYHGVSASPGLAHGPAFIFFQKEMEVPVYGVSREEFEKEVKRFEEALQRTKEAIVNLKTKVANTLGEYEERIFDAHLLVLEDKALIDGTIKELSETGYNIDYCFHSVSKRYIKGFEEIDDEYIRDRALDIRDVSKRVLRDLLGENQVGLLNFNEQKVVITEELTPSDTVGIKKDCILAIVTEKGGSTSHSVIMARALQIPAVVGLRNITDHLTNDSYVIVDGYDGLVIANPTEETLARYVEIKRERRDVQKIFESVNHLSAMTKDELHFPLMVNMENIEDIRRAREVGAHGVGLFRTEALYLKRNSIPTEDEQFESYKRIVEGMAPHSVTIRTLDLGGDKKFNGLLLSGEEVNPLMGVRAIRLCLDQIEEFKKQLRAIMRASAFGKVRILYPMITNTQELVLANETLEEVKEELRKRGIQFDQNVEVGSMIETPSAALTIDLLAPHCGFLSIGTNDLIQYLLAVDRVNHRISHLYQPHHPAVIRILEMIIRAGHGKGMEISVCGEMAGDPVYAALLLGMGVDSLSIIPSLLPEVKYFIRHMKLEDAKTMAKQVIQETEASRILKILREFYFERVGEVWK